MEAEERRRAEDLTTEAKERGDEVVPFSATGESPTQKTEKSPKRKKESAAEIRADVARIDDKKAAAARVLAQDKDLEGEAATALACTPALAHPILAPCRPALNPHPYCSSIHPPAQSLPPPNSSSASVGAARAAIAKVQNEDALARFKKLKEVPISQRLAPVAHTTQLSHRFSRTGVQVKDSCSSSRAWTREAPRCLCPCASKRGVQHRCLRHGHILHAVIPWLPSRQPARTWPGLCWQPRAMGVGGRVAVARMKVARKHFPPCLHPRLAQRSGSPRCSFRSWKSLSLSHSPRLRPTSRHHSPASRCPRSRSIHPQKTIHSSSSLALQPASRRA